MNLIKKSLMIDWTKQAVLALFLSSATTCFIQSKTNPNIQDSIKPTMYNDMDEIDEDDMNFDDDIIEEKINHAYKSNSTFSTKTEKALNVPVFSPETGSDASGIEIAHEIPNVSIPLEPPTMNFETKKSTKSDNELNQLLDKVTDSKFKIGGSITQSGAISRSTTLLNTQLPDTGNFLRSTIDLKFSGECGEKKFGHKAIETELTFRHRNVWGGSAGRSEKDYVILADSVVGSHTHAFSKPVLWMYNGWVDISLDALSGIKGIAKEEATNNLKMGYFSYSLGRGIALGDSYGTSQDYLGIFTMENDFLMPGILLYGSLVPERLKYELYFARPESRSASAKQTLALTKEYVIDRSPFGGAFRDDNIIAASLIWSEKYHEKGSLKLNPYVVYHWGMDKTLELPFDSHLQLGTAGLCGDITSDTLEAGFDCAMNFGQQEALKIDRNNLQIAVDDNGVLVEQFGKILLNGKPAPATAELRAELNKNPHLAEYDSKGNLVPGSANFTLGANDYTSATDRFRQKYTNKFRGQMFMMDLAYNFEKTKTKLALAMGYASGGDNPNKNDKDMVHTGFVGINESISAMRVPSMIILGGANIKRPLALSSDGSTTLEDFITGSFTDILFTGLGVTKKLQADSLNKVSFNTNALAFWKDKPGQAITINNLGIANIDSSRQASKFLGVELNSTVTCEPLNGFKCAIKAAVFLPGSYYNDIKGAKLKDKVAKRLDTVSTLGNFVNVYKLGSNPCFSLGIEGKYSF